MKCPNSKEQLCQPVAILHNTHTHMCVSANFMCAKTFNKDDNDDSVNDDVAAQLNFMWLCDTNNMIYMSAVEIYTVIIILCTSEMKLNRPKKIA